ncbi:cytochrome c oxidase assembly factor 5 [Pectinophora gossypiella]|uniref:cytochrome c oxidase assembly factor 5 n=1 Tax=Pectinophora gossypiella TaxID=13191 RepID=UPI00214E937D|nr:cytochrome c oxidase assembly factor 5 [Pectinophora gossypiella]
MVSFAPDEVGLADKSPCAGIRADLKMCLLESDCCRKDKKTPRECLQAHLVPEECMQLRHTFFECKRSLLDNRRRFRGHKGY